MSNLDKKSQSNFNGGELSPLLIGRTDLDIWQRGCRQMQNMFSRKYGNAERRIGLQYVGEVKDSSKEVRLLPFQNTENDGTIIEMGEGYFRYFKNGTAVESGGSAYEVTNPYSDDELFDVQFKEINDIVLMTHPDNPVQRLSHYADTNWTMEDAPFDEPVFMDANTDDSITIAPSATTGTGITLTANSGIFDSTMVGGYFKLGQKKLTTTVKLSETVAGSYTSSTITVKGNFTWRTSGTWEGTALIQRLDGSTWTTVYTFESSKDQNFNQELSQSDDKYHDWRIYFTLVDKDGSPAKVYLESLETYVYGWAKITGYTSAYVVTATVESDFENTSATNVWMEGAWSPYRGYPRTVAFFQDCMFYGGTTHQPQTFWKSYSGDYYNFEGITGVTSIQNDYAVSATMGSTERIFQKWMEILGTSVVVGTSSSEFAISGSSDGGDAITATNILVKSDTSTGSSGVRPVRVGNAILHVQRDGKNVYELTYSLQKYGFGDSDITQFAEHVTEGCTIVDMWYSRQPDGVLYAVRSDGVLLACVYDQDQKVLAWARFVTQGLFKSGACIHTENGDENWVIVQRTLGDGTIKKYIERFSPIAWIEQSDCVYLDSVNIFDHTPAPIGEIAVPSIYTDGYLWGFRDNFYDSPYTHLVDKIDPSDYSVITSYDIGYSSGSLYGARLYPVCMGSVIYCYVHDGTHDFVRSLDISTGSVATFFTPTIGYSSWCTDGTYIYSLNKNAGDTVYKIDQSATVSTIYSAAQRMAAGIYFYQYDSEIVLFDYYFNGGDARCVVLSTSGSVIKSVSLNVEGLPSSRFNNVFIASIGAYPSRKIVIGVNAYDLSWNPRYPCVWIVDISDGSYTSVDVSDHVYTGTGNAWGILGIVSDCNTGAFVCFDSGIIHVESDGSIKEILTNYYGITQFGLLNNDTLFLNVSTTPIQLVNSVYSLSVSKECDGLSHLEGLEVDILCDGVQVDSQTVTDGKITLESYFSKAVIGLGYESLLEPMGLDGGSSAGACDSVMRRIRKAFVRVKDTYGAQFGVNDLTDTLTYSDMPIRDNAGTLSDSTDLYTGVIECETGGNYLRDPRFVLKQDTPLPMNVLGITYLFESPEQQVKRNNSNAG